MAGRDHEPLASVWEDHCPQQANCFSLSATPLPAQRRNTDLSFLTAQGGISTAAAAAAAGHKANWLANDMSRTLFWGTAHCVVCPSRRPQTRPGFRPPVQPEIRHHKLTAALSLPLQTVSRSDSETLAAAIRT